MGLAHTLNILWSKRARPIDSMGRSSRWSKRFRTYLFFVQLGDFHSFTFFFFFVILKSGKIMGAMPFSLPNPEVNEPPSPQVVVVSYVEGLVGMHKQSCQQ